MTSSGSGWRSGGLGDSSAATWAWPLKRGERHADEGQQAEHRQDQDQHDAAAAVGAWVGGRASMGASPPRKRGGDGRVGIGQSRLAWKKSWRIVMRLDPLVRRVDDPDLDLDAPQRDRVGRRVGTGRSAGVGPPCGGSWAADVGVVGGPGIPDAPEADDRGASSPTFGCTLGTGGCGGSRPSAAGCAPRGRGDVESESRRGRRRRRVPSTVEIAEIDILLRRGVVGLDVEAADVGEDEVLLGSERQAGNIRGRAAMVDAGSRRLGAVPPVSVPQAVASRAAEREAAEGVLKGRQHGSRATRAGPAGTRKAGRRPKACWSGGSVRPVCHGRPRGR